MDYIYISSVHDLSTVSNQWSNKKTIKHDCKHIYVIQKIASMETSMARSSHINNDNDRTDSFEN